MGKFKTVRFTSIQREHLVAFLNSNPKLKTGKFSSEFTIKKAQELWKELAILLNDLPGATKTWKQWRKTWQDMRCNKRKQFRRHHQIETALELPEEILLHEAEEKMLISHADICELDTFDMSFNYEEVKDKTKDSHIKIDHDYVHSHGHCESEEAFVNNKSLDSSEPKEQEDKNANESSEKDKYYELKAKYIVKKMNYLDAIIRMKEKKLEYKASIADSLKIISKQLVLNNL